MLLQEIERYNVLLSNMFNGLSDLQKSIKGLVLMSAELEDIFNSMLEGRVPQVWLAGTYFVYHLTSLHLPLQWYFYLFFTYYGSFDVEL